MAPFELKFVVVFLAASLGLTVAAIHSSLWFAWPAATFAIVALGYAGLGAQPFGKGTNGRLNLFSTVILAPYLFFAWLVLLLLRLGHEAGHHEIRPRLFLGRRALSARELPKDVSLVVDMTAEFPGTHVNGVEYIALPTLDGSVPRDVAAARRVVERVRAADGVVYVHCAAGHGRSAAIVAAVLVAEGLAENGRQAIALMRKIRPGVSLSRSQRAFVDTLIAGDPTRKQKTDDAR